MFEIAHKIDISLPLLLLLVALLGFRSRVSPGASVTIRAPVEHVYNLLDLRDGKEQHWHRSQVSVNLVDRKTETYRMRFVSHLTNGTRQASEALFRVAERKPHRLLHLDRAGLEGRSTNSELLRIEAQLQDLGDQSKLHLKYHWGPRPLMAQLLARVDLWAGIYRLKGLAETGQPDHRTDGLISAGVAIVTGLMTFVAFGLWQGWVIAGILVLALFVHELGHLIAFKLIGQPWGRVVFLPFLGALAMPRLPYHLQAESIFAALMGPGFSLVIPGAVALDLLWDGTAHPLVLIIGVITTALNLFNLLPVEPLDGGVALRSIMGKLFGSRANYGLCAIGAVMMIVGWFLKEPLLLVFGGISILANWKPRRIDPGLVPLSNLQCCISIFGFVALATSYIAIWELLVSHV